MPSFHGKPITKADKIQMKAEQTKRITRSATKKMKLENLMKLERWGENMIIKQCMSPERQMELKKIQREMVRQWYAIECKLIVETDDENEDEK